MGFRQRVGLNVAPIFLRLALGVIFMWAGLGKLLETDVEVTPENAVAFVEMDAIDATRVADLLPPGYQPAPPRRAPAPPTDDEPAAPPADDDGDQGAMAPTEATIIHAVLISQPDAADPDADRAPPALELKRLYGIALMVYNAARPTTDSAGQPRMALLPEMLGKGEAPKWIAWVHAFTEIFAGGFLLMGFLTRLSALALSGVMLMAMWLTEIGPAMLSGRNYLGFIPRPESGSPFDTFGYMHLAWLLAILAGALALVFLGPGMVSLDRLLFGGPRRDDDLQD